MRLLLTMVAASFSLLSFAASPRQQAKNLCDSLTGVACTNAQLDEFEAVIVAQTPLQAAEAITLTETFLLNVKDWATHMTNEAETMDFPFTDMAATIVGYARDDRDFKGILSDDVVYVPGADLTQYSYTSNQAYLDFDANFNLLSDPLQLIPQAQSTATGLGTAAGILTSRGFGEAFLNAGTNRAAVRSTYVNFLCRDMEGMFDNTISDSFVRQDVPRNPGRDSLKYITTCKGCHSGMDPQSSAFAYLDFILVDEDDPDLGASIVYTPGIVMPKVVRAGDTAPEGHRTESDEWNNLWIDNTSMGWDSTKRQGNGPASWGDMITSSRQFNVCIAEKVFTSTCRAPIASEDRAQVDSLANEFAADGNLRMLFARSAVACVDD